MPRANVVKNTLKVVDSNMTDNVKVTIKGREYVTANSVVTGKNFVNYQEIYDAVKAAGGYYDENDNWVDEDGSALCAMFNRAECEVDVMAICSYAAWRITARNYIPTSAPMQVRTTVSLKTVWRFTRMAK